jgi:hypothetical protein
MNAYIELGILFTLLFNFHKILLLLLLFFVVLGFELRAYTLSHSTSLIFVVGIFEIGSHKLFAQAGFEP